MRVIQPETEHVYNYVYPYSIAYLDGKFDQMGIVEGAWWRSEKPWINIISRHNYGTKLGIGLLAVTQEAEGLRTRVAAIEAFEQPTGNTLVRFVDGRQPFYVRTTANMFPFGVSFDKFRQMMIKKLELSPYSDADSTIAGTPELGEAKPCERFVFRKTGEHWIIAYKQDSFLMSDVKGLRLLACLLGKPEEQIHVLELEAAVSQSTEVTPLAQLRGAQSEDQLMVTHDGTNSEVIDSLTRKNVEKRLHEIADERELASAMGDSDKIKKLNQEVSEIESYLKEATGLRGNTRQFSSEAEKARSRIRQAIRSAIKKVKEHDHDLFYHLDQSIRTGFHCSYHPSEKIDWKL